MSIDYAPPPSYLEETGRTSPAIDSVWAYAKERILDKSIFDPAKLRSDNILNIVQDFACNRVEQPAVYDIAATYGLVEDAFKPDIRYNNARTAIRHYNHPELYPEASIPNREHYVAMATDFRLVNELLHEEHDTYREKYGLTKFHEQISLSQPSFPPIDITKIVRLLSEDTERYPDCEGVNIESILVQAAAMLDTVRTLYESEEPDLAKLATTMYAIEAFYAPVCEIIGYDALAMTLRDYTMRIRVQQSEPVTVTEADGTQQVLTGKARITRAEKAIKELGTPEKIEATVTEAIQGLFGENVSILPIENQSGHDTLFAAGVVVIKDEDGKDKHIKVRWRVKSVGSLATKYAKEAEPLDLVGITLVPDEKDTRDKKPALNDVAALFSTLITKSNELGASEPTSTSSRDSAFIVHGSKDYIDIMNKASGDNDIHMEKRSNGFQAAKATLRYKAVPMEISIQTPQDRRVARIGQASHPIYKAVGHSADVPKELLEDMLHIAQRKYSVNEELTPQSRERAEEMLRRIDLAPRPPHIGSRAAAAAGVKRPQ